MTVSRFLLVLAVSLLFLGACAKSPEATVESFYYAVGKGEITEAKQYLASDVAGVLGPDKLAAVLAKQAEEIQRCGGIKSMDVKLKGEGEIRTGTIRVVYKGDCEPEHESVKLVQEEGRWKIGADK